MPSHPTSGRNLGDLENTTILHVTLVLPLTDAAGAEHFAQDASRPDSAGYGKYLTATQFAARFGASETYYAELTAWATANGLAVGRPAIARTTLRLTGDAATFGRLFSTHLMKFQTRAGKIGFAPAALPVMPAALVGKVVAVLGLSDAKAATPLYRPRPANMPPRAMGSGGYGGYGPVDLRGLYGVPAPIAKTTGQTIALYEEGGFVTADVGVYKTKFGLPNIPVVIKSVNGSPTGDTPGVDIESDIDVDMAIAINPHLKQVLVYEDAVDEFSASIANTMNDVGDDGVAKTLSISYGGDENDFSKSQALAIRNAALQLAAEGVTVFVSSGDSGAYGGTAPPNASLNTSLPSTDPYVTAVGGTTLFAIQGQYAGEEAWNLLGFGEGATGGGVSDVFALPKWQALAGVSVAVANGGSATMRNVPDVAAVGDPSTGVAVYNKANGGWLVYGGTSVSSPIWAGFNSILNDARAGAGLPALGFANPLIYSLGAAAFGLNDVSDGTNGNPTIYGLPGYSAGYGFDDTTGFGSINVNAYTYPVLVGAHAPGARPGLVHGITADPTSKSVTVNWAAAANATGYLVTVRAANDAGPVINAVTMHDGVVVGGLKAGEAYYLYVTSLNPSGSNSPAAVFFSTRTN